MTDEKPVSPVVERVNRAAAEYEAALRDLAAEVAADELLLAQANERLEKNRALLAAIELLTANGFVTVTDGVITVAKPDTE